MDGGTIGLLGGILGSLIGLAGAFYGCRASYRAAGSDAERRFLARVFVYGGLAMGAFLAVTVAASLGYLPPWTQWIAMALLFGSLGFAITWLNRRLSQFRRTSNDLPHGVDNGPLRR